MSVLLEAECLRNYNNLVHNYNMLYEKYSNLNRQYKTSQTTLQTYKDDFEEKIKLLLSNIKIRMKRERIDSERIESLQFKLCEEEDENVKFTRQLNNVIGVINKIQGCLQQGIQVASEKRENGVLNACPNVVNENVNTCQNQDNGDSNTCQNQEEGDSNGLQNQDDGHHTTCENHEDGDITACQNHEEGDSNGLQNQDDGNHTTCENHESGDLTACQNQEDGDSNGLQNQDNGNHTTCENHENGDLTACQNKKDGNIYVCDKCSLEFNTSESAKSTYENESMAEQLSETTQCSCENKLAPQQCSKDTQTYGGDDSMTLEETPIGSCEHSGCGDTQELLGSIEKCHESKELCEPIKLLLKQSKSAICSLKAQNNTQSKIIKRYEDDRKCYTEKLHEELDKSKNKDSEICTLKDDLKYLANYLCKFKTEKENLESSLNKTLNELCSKTEMYDELYKEKETLNNELENRKYSLDMRTNQSETLKRDLCEQKNVIDSYIQANQALECNLNSAEQKLKESETLKDICQERCNNLTTQNLELKKDLECEKTENCQKDREITELCDQIHKLEAMLKGLECQSALNAGVINKLKEEKSVVIQKFNEEINELNCVIQTMRNELAIMNSEYACAQEHILKVDNENVHLNEKINSLQCDVENLEKQAQDHKREDDEKTKKYLIMELDLSASKNMIEVLKTDLGKVNCEFEKQSRQISLMCENMEALQCELKETVEKNQELTCNCQRLEKENCELAEKNDELCESLAFAKNMEIAAQNNLIICKEKLLVSADEISNLKLGIECLERKLHKKTTEQTHMEHTLQETTCKLVEETYRIEEINANHNLNVTNESCPQTKCRVSDSFTMTSNDPPCCLQPATCQTELNEEYNTCLLEENERLNCENTRLSMLTRDLEENVRKLCEANAIFEQSIKDLTAKNQAISKSSVDMSLCSCPSNECSCCPDTNIAKKCDCLANFSENENLRCQLVEIKQLFEEKENAAKKLLCDAEERHYIKEMEMKNNMDETKSQHLKKMAEIEAQLETYETMILHREKALQNYQLKEEKYNTEIEKLKEKLKIKDQKSKQNIEHEQKNITSLTLSTNDNKTQNEGLLDKIIEEEKSNEEKLDERLRTTDGYEVQHQKTVDLESHLTGNEYETQKQKTFKAHDVTNSTRTNKRPKAGSEIDKLAKFVTDLYIPCCIGSKNPCKRQIEQTKMQDEYRVHGMSLESRLEMYRDKLTAGSDTTRTPKQGYGHFVDVSKTLLAGVKSDKKSLKSRKSMKKSKKYMNSADGDKLGRPGEKTDTAVCSLPETCIQSLKRELQQNVCGDNPKCGQKDCCRNVRFK